MTVPSHSYLPLHRVHFSGATACDPGGVAEEVGGEVAGDVWECGSRRAFFVPDDDEEVVGGGDAPPIATAVTELFKPLALPPIELV